MVGVLSQIRKKIENYFKAWEKSGNFKLSHGKFTSMKEVTEKSRNFQLSHGKFTSLKEGREK